MPKSKIEWTQSVWNPVVGCSKLSDGCLNCYAGKMHHRLNAMGLEKYKEPFDVVRLHGPSLSIPSKTKKPTVYFVNSMSDLFHEDLSRYDIYKIFREINKNTHHIFLILTKRPERLFQLLKDPDFYFNKKGNIAFPDNLWLGVTVESSKYLHRIETLQKIPAKHKFISFEPLIGSPLKYWPDSNNSKKWMDDHNFLVDWIIVGGESGNKAREMLYSWVLVLKEYSEFYNIPFFFKQWGSYPGKPFAPKDAFLEGKEYKQFPPAIAELMEGKKK